MSASETKERTHLKLSNKFVRYNLSGMKALLSESSGFFMLEAWLVQTEILLIASVRWKLPDQNRSFFYFVKIIYIQSIKLGSTKDLLGWNLYHYSNVTRAESHSYRHIFKLFSCNQSWTICHKAQNDSEDGWCEFRPENILCGKNLICILRH